MASKLKPRSFLVAIFVLVHINTLFVSAFSSLSEENQLDIEAVVPEAMKNILTDEIANYEVPQYVKDNYVYYHSGYDDEKRPIWVVETGKWDIRAMVDGGSEKFDIYDKFLRKGIFKVLNSTLLTTTPEEPVNQVIVILDMDEYDFNQLRSMATTAYLIGSFRKYVPAFVKLHSAFLLNSNYLAERMINLIRPVLGKEFDKVEVYGTNKAKWIPRILKHIPRTQLPEWYGGIKDFKPVQVYG